MSHRSMSHWRTCPSKHTSADTPQRVHFSLRVGCYQRNRGASHEKTLNCFSNVFSETLRILQKTTDMPSAPSLLSGRQFLWNLQPPGSSGLSTSRFSGSLETYLTYVTGFGIGLPVLTRACAPASPTVSRLSQAPIISGTSVTRLPTFSAEPSASGKPSVGQSHHVAGTDGEVSSGAGPDSDFPDRRKLLRAR
jgi:hypothetical protein